MPLFLYNLLLPIFFVLYLPFYLVHLIRRGSLSRSFLERIAVFTAAKKARLTTLEAPVWVHAVSVGETVVALGFIQQWQQREPQRCFVLSTTTTTGQALACRKAPSAVTVVYCPLDFAFLVRRFLRLLQPAMLVIFEVEIWPNLITLTAKQNVPVVLVNGRMSDKSAAGYARHRWFFQPLLRQLAALCVQTQADAERVNQVLAAPERLHVCNTMKFDQIPDQDSADLSAALTQAFGAGTHRLLVAGSTHPGEEALIVEAYSKLRPEFPDLRLVLVPRHVERSGEIEALLQQRQLPYQLFAGNAAAAADTAADVLLVNATGELMRFYSVAELVVVGKSFAGQRGGHNIIEPAIFAKPILHGQHMQNFRGVVAIFAEADASISIADDQQLLPQLRRLLADPQDARRLGQRARAVVEQQRGAIGRTLDVLLPLLPKPTRQHQNCVN